ncbi:ABC transporter substrate-binding protein [Cutibacterium sp. V970]|uniref:ABC transporter substrate-binding protein n=1 Tax=Cutibacterium sp. V970 TaxID=3446481 RepID=UPI003EE2CBF1
MPDVTRRVVLGTALAAAVGGGLSWRRLTGLDIPGRGDDALTVAINGTAQDAAANEGLVQAFHAAHPDIRVRITPVQGTDWSDFFAKILTLVAAGTAPDVVMVATEGTQLFADRLAEPLDDYVRRDKEEMKSFFNDVHPALIEAFMYQGSLFELPLSFNAANMYMSHDAMAKAGLGYPDVDWTWDDFHDCLKKLRKKIKGEFRPFFWTNRLWGGIVPWLCTNDTNFLTPRQFSGGEWLWDEFYPEKERRGGGYRWGDANALDPRVIESFDFMRELVSEELASSPVQGGGNELVNRFGDGLIGMTPAGGFWVYGLDQAGMRRNDYDVAYFPKKRTQKHSFGSAGYAIMRGSKRKDEAWEWLKFCTSPDGMRIAQTHPDSSSARRSHNKELYEKLGPNHWNIFYETLDRFPNSEPIPAPPRGAAVETALTKNVVGAVGGSYSRMITALHAMQRDLELALGEKK